MCVTLQNQGTVPLKQLCRVLLAQRNHLKTDGERTGRKNRQKQKRHFCDLQILFLPPLLKIHYFKGEKKKANWIKQRTEQWASEGEVIKKSKQARYKLKDCAGSGIHVSGWAALGFEPAEKLWGFLEGLWCWAGLLFSQPMSLTKITVWPQKSSCQYSTGVWKSRNCFLFLVELAETVHTLYVLWKCSISAAGNGKFRPETDRM